MVNIVIEGIDKSGKDTLIGHIREIFKNNETNFSYLVNPTKSCDSMFRKASSLKEADEALLKGFCENESKMTNGIFLQNRTWLSNIAYSENEVRRKNLTRKYLSKFKKPDLVILVTLEKSLMSQRYMTSELDHIENQPINTIMGRQNNYKKVCKELNLNAVIIDGKDVHSSLRLVMKHIYETITNTPLSH